MAPLRAIPKGSVVGSYTTNSVLSLSLKKRFRESGNWVRLPGTATGEHRHVGRSEGPQQNGDGNSEQH